MARRREGEERRGRTRKWKRKRARSRLEKKLGEGREEKE